MLAVSAASVFAESAAGVRWTAPAGWKAEAARPMRAATYSIPLAAGDQGIAECVVNYFGPGQGGGVDANIERWRGQVLGADGKPAVAKIDKRTGRGMPITVIDTSGTYTGMGGPMIGRCETGAGLSPDRRDRRRPGRQRVLQADGAGEDNRGAAEKFRAAARVDPSPTNNACGGMPTSIVALHFVLLRRSSSVLGGLLALRWPRVVWLHVPAVIWGALVEFTGWICPLTPLENRLRRASGETGYQGDFIAHYILPALYPNGLTRTDQLVLGGMALALNVVIYTSRGRSAVADRAAQRHMIEQPMNWDLQGWPASARTALLSLLVIAVAYVIGRVAQRIVATQLAALAQRTGSRWIEPAVEAVAQRVPFWSVLVGDLHRRGILDSPPRRSRIDARQGPVRHRRRVADVPRLGSARQVRARPRAGHRSLAADDDAHREPRPHRRRDPRVARHPARAGPDRSRRF